MTVKSLAVLEGTLIFPWRQNQRDCLAAFRSAEVKASLLLKDM
jgi:hypothetical protein